MTNFFRTPKEGKNAFVDRSKGGINFMYVPIGVEREVGLRGGTDLYDLTVDFNDRLSATSPARCVEQQVPVKPGPGKPGAARQIRLFTIKPNRVGSTMLEARKAGVKDAVDYLQVVVEEPLAWGAKVSPAFRTKLREIAGRLEIEADELMAVIAMETGKSFSAQQRSKNSSAVGLIQFMPDTAKSYGTSTSALVNMSAVTQLDYVEKHLKRAMKEIGVVKSLEDLYMCVLRPASVGAASDSVLYRRGFSGYAGNKLLDADGDGNITKYEATEAVRKLLVEGRSSKNLG